MKVSIIIPSYNYAAYLGQCLDSILAQSWKDWEVWVIDDGSTDNTREIAQLYQEKDSRINYHFQENSGLSHARNKGIKLCKGYLIQFLDADDLLSEEKLSLQVQHLEENPAVAISYCQTWYFDSKSPEKVFEDIALKNRNSHPVLDCKGYELVQSLIRGNFTTVSSPLIRKGIVNHGITFPETVSNSEDWYFWIQCALAGFHVQFLDNPAAYTKIRVHKGSMSQQKLKMYYGELQLRKWLSLQLINTSLSAKEKEHLLILNQAQEEKLFEHTMLTGPLWDFAHLKKMYQFSDLNKMLKYHKLARKHQHTHPQTNF
ncbi:glycosyltransferase family 2 protein [Algoriphagus vanfongensis]|uniref:glycosyltransferase family 2 protein n=1 Tax=Algoriphagus vanfongensis TaxID=426371 RepID=UPI000411C7DA|nr:glycosyltransferase family 2 protein [Algoriphagus vanfongensis]